MAATYTPLTEEILAANGWRKSYDLMTLTKIQGGIKFRIGWRITDHKFYIGYGELPIPVESVEHLILLMFAIGLGPELVNFKYDNHGE